MNGTTIAAMFVGLGGILASIFTFINTQASNKAAITAAKDKVDKENTEQRRVAEATVQMALEVREEKARVERERIERDRADRERVERERVDRQLRDYYDAISEDFRGAMGQIASLNTLVTANQKTISELIQKVEALETQVAERDVKLSASDAKIAALTADNAALRAEVADLKLRLKACEDCFPPKEAG